MHELGTLDARVAVDWVANSLLHVTGATGKRNVHTAGGAGTGLDTALVVLDGSGGKITTSVVDSTLDKEDASIAGLVVGAVGTWAGRSSSRSGEWSHGSAGGRGRDSRASRAGKTAGGPGRVGKTGGASAGKDRARRGRGDRSHPGLVRRGGDPSTIDARVDDGGSEWTTLHVTGRTRKRDEGAAAGVGTSVHASSDVASTDPCHAKVTTSVVNTAGNGKGTVGADILGVVGCWARDDLAVTGCGTIEDSKVAGQLVHAQTVCTTTVHGRVTGTCGKTVSEDAGNWSSVCGKIVVTETLVSVLKTGILVALAATVVQATRDINTVGPPVVGIEGAVGTVVGTTSKVGPAIFSVVILHWCTDRGRGSGAVLGGCIGPLNWVTSGKCVHGAVNLLVDLRSKHTSIALVVGEKVKDRAVGNETALVKASVSSLLKSRDVPAVDEVTVVSVSSGVTHREDEWLPSVLWDPPLKVGGVPDGLEEDGDQVDGVRGRAWTVVVRVLGWEGHVRLVGLVEVDTVPARREEDLSTKTVRADLIGELVRVWRGGAVVQADKGDSLL